MSGLISWVFEIIYYIAFGFKRKKEPKRADMENFTQIDEQRLPERKVMRRQLLPWWMKISCWFFMLIGVGSVAAMIYGLFGNEASLSLYGFDTKQPSSLIGLMIVAIMIFKGYAAFLLWFEKDRAIDIAKIDALCGISLCVISMFAVPLVNQTSDFSFRLEILVLVAFYAKLNRIEYAWDNLEQE
jgi:magnesium-transporting ATPase (P-type)